MGVAPDALSPRHVHHRLMPPSRRNATHVEVILEDGGIHGVVRDSRGRETTFTGWLSLIAAVEACRQQGQDDSAAPGPPEHGRNPSAPA
jgi:hypothetical protein